MTIADIRGISVTYLPTGAMYDRMQYCMKITEAWCSHLLWPWELNVLRKHSRKNMFIYCDLIHHL